MRLGNKKTRPGGAAFVFFYSKFSISRSNGVTGHFCRNILAIIALTHQVGYNQADRAAGTIREGRPKVRVVCLRVRAVVRPVLGVYDNAPTGLEHYEIR
jgi:hypothetical protein